MVAWTEEVKNMFKDELQTEWQRLNPVYTKSDDGFFRATWNAGRETLPGYFAPVRLACWMIKRIWLAAMTQSNQP